MQIQISIIWAEETISSEFTQEEGFILREQKKWKWLSHVWLFWDPMDYTVHRILQARILEWVDFLFSGGSFQPRDQT